MGVYKRVCILCGKEIVKRSSNAKYCKMCADSMTGMSPKARAVFKESMRSRSQGIESRSRPSDGYSIERIIKLASEAGMRYGEYVSLMDKGFI